MTAHVASFFGACVASSELLVENGVEGACGRGGGGEAGGGVGKTGSNEPWQEEQMMWENLTLTKEKHSLTSLNPKMDSFNR